MKQPSRNKALLSQLKKAREHLPPETAAGSAQSVTAANVTPAEAATDATPLSAASVSPAGSNPTPAPASTPTPTATPPSVVDVATPPRATDPAPTEDSTRASQAFGVVPPPAAEIATSESSPATSDWPAALARHTGPGQWTHHNLLAALAASLPPDFPAICYGAEEICPRGIYRSVQRSRGGSAVRFSGPGGTREFTPLRTSETYQRWLKHFTRHHAPEPQRDAVRLCCAELVTHLESFEDYQRERWTKTIDPLAWAPLETTSDAS